MNNFGKFEKIAIQWIALSTLRTTSPWRVRARLTFHEIKIGLFAPGGKTTAMENSRKIFDQAGSTTRFRNTETCHANKAVVESAAKCPPLKKSETLLRSFAFKPLRLIAKANSRKLSNPQRGFSNIVII